MSVFMRGVRSGHPRNLCIILNKDHHDSSVTSVPLEPIRASCALRSPKPLIPQTLMTHITMYMYIYKSIYIYIYTHLYMYVYIYIYAPMMPSRDCSVGNIPPILCCHADPATSDKIRCRHVARRLSVPSQQQDPT